LTHRVRFLDAEPNDGECAIGFPECANFAQPSAFPERNPVSLPNGSYHGKSEFISGAYGTRARNAQFVGFRVSSAYRVHPAGRVHRRAAVASCAEQRLYLGIVDCGKDRRIGAALSPIRRLLAHLASAALLNEFAQLVAGLLKRRRDLIPLQIGADSHGSGSCRRIQRVPITIRDLNQLD
jgi:hypothetical protein